MFFLGHFLEQNKQKLSLPLSQLNPLRMNTCDDNGDEIVAVVVSVNGPFVLRSEKNRPRGW